ncbi:MAG: M15 family metallopeptidase [Eubacteriales bacterium]|nr:M15 family metallopeptidase [Eubacteriales bacterium]
MDTKNKVIENTDSSGFVLLSDIIPEALLDIRYYTTFNFLGERVDGYEEPVALMTREAALALKEVSDDAISRGYRLKNFDTYRPQCAVDHFVRWADKTRELAMKDYFYPEIDKRFLFQEGFVALKSGHSRGSTVDLTLFDMATQKDLDVGGTFDYFGSLSWAQNTESITEEQAANRKMLRDLMLSHGFHPLAEEWWHFTLDNEPYPDTYFTFPVNSHQVKKQEIFAEKLEKDQEFRLRFFDFAMNLSEKNKTILNTAASQVVSQSMAELRGFAEKENVAIDENQLNTAVNKFMHDITEMIGQILK